MEGPREEFLPWTASHHDHEFSPLQTIIVIIIIIIIIIIEISKRQLHIIRLNHVLLDINKFSKDTAFMFTFTPFSSVKLTASKNF